MYCVYFKMCISVSHVSRFVVGFLYILHFRHLADTFIQSDSLYIILYLFSEYVQTLGSKPWHLLPALSSYYCATVKLFYTRCNTSMIMCRYGTYFLSTSISLYVLSLFRFLQHPQISLVRNNVDLETDSERRWIQVEERPHTPQLSLSFHDLLVKNQMTNKDITTVWGEENHCWIPDLVN